MTLVKVDNTVFDSLHKKSIDKKVAIEHEGINGLKLEASGSKIDDDKILKFFDPNSSNEEDYISRNGGGWEEFK